MNWSGGLVEWVDDNKAYLSAVFSWQLEKAFQRAAWFKAMGYEVIVGGPAVYTHPDFFDGVAVVGNKADALWRHNPEATFTSRGCLRSCPFCIVPKIEGDLVEIKDWEVKPIICDNNLLATSKEHFDSVIDRLKPLKGIDFNQGLDARLLTNHHAERLRELDTSVIRIAWDDIKSEKAVMKAIALLQKAGFNLGHVRVYVLIGFIDTPEDALYRLQALKDLGLMPNPMRYQPLDSLQRNIYVGKHWTDVELKNYMRYWSRQIWLGHIPFEEYDFRKANQDRRLNAQPARTNQ